MPTIEIISVGARFVPRVHEFRSFAVLAEKSVVSHRGLFQRDLKRLHGVIVHLGNPDLGPKTGYWFAGDLVQWPEGASDGSFQFEPAVLHEFEVLMNRMIDASPTAEVMFLTDIQSSDPARRFRRRLEVDQFWSLHGEGKLHFNTLYRIQGSRTRRYRQPR